MLQVKLLEMPLAELEQSVKDELNDNPALEKSMTDDPTAANDDQDIHDNESFEQQQEREEREEALDNALQNIGRDDEMPVAYGQNNSQNADYEEIVYGDTTSFYDKLKEQVGEEELTDEEQDVMEYLIGSLDDDGYLRKSADTIQDELAIYHNIDVSEEKIHQLIQLLQSFDPAGIGACSLQECLRLQIERRPDGWLREKMMEVVNNCFDEFTKKHWDRIKDALHLSDSEADTVRKELQHLNPKPGSSLGETQGISTQQITPDFIIDTNDDGSIQLSLNQGDVPALTISPSFADMLDTYKNNKRNMNRNEKEALLYAKEKVEKAQGFITAIEQRRNTLLVTMRAIIDWQKDFFRDGNEADIKPMRLEDIANITHLDRSTISRVCTIKYAQTRWGTFPLRHFFSDEYVTDSGEKMSTRKIKIALKEIIDKEDKKKPLSDEALATELKKKGFPVARRTVAKYREQLGFPVARLRK